jgi:hypothetical protein
MKERTLDQISTHNFGITICTKNLGALAGFKIYSDFESGTYEAANFKDLRSSNAEKLIKKIESDGGSPIVLCDSNHHTAVDKSLALLNSKLNRESTEDKQLEILKTAPESKEIFKSISECSYKSHFLDRKLFTLVCDFGFIQILLASCCLPGHKSWDTKIFQVIKGWKISNEKPVSFQTENSDVSVYYGMSSENELYCSKTKAERYFNNKGKHLLLHKNMILPNDILASSILTRLKYDSPNGKKIPEEYVNQVKDYLMDNSNKSFNIKFGHDSNFKEYRIERDQISDIDALDRFSALTDGCTESNQMRSSISNVYEY